MRSGFALIWIGTMTAMVMLLAAVPERLEPLAAPVHFSDFR